MGERVEIITPREAAIDLIRPYSGASLDWIRSTYMGYCYAGHRVQIGGHIHRADGAVETHSPDWIIVYELGGEVVNVKFSLREIYAELQSPQMGLFDAD